MSEKEQVKPAAKPLNYGRNISLTEAKKIAETTEALALENNWNMAIAIVEPNGNLVLMQRMDNTQYGSLDVALKKAVTSAKFKRSSSVFQTAVQNGALFPVFIDAMAVDGGELIIKNNEIIGAIGISGATAIDDGMVARAAVESLE